MSLDHSAPTGPVQSLRGHLRFHYGDTRDRTPDHFGCINCGASIDRTPGARPRYFGSALCSSCQDPERFGFARTLPTVSQDS